MPSSQKVANRSDTEIAEEDQAVIDAVQMTKTADQEEVSKGNWPTVDATTAVPFWPAQMNKTADQEEVSQLPHSGKQN